MKNKFIKIITKSIALAVVIAFFSTYFYVVWNYYDPVQKKFVEPIKKASYIPFAYGAQFDIYWDDLCFGTDDEGYNRIKVKFQHNQYLCFSSGTNTDWSYGAYSTYDNHLRLYLSNFGLSNTSLIPDKPSNIDWSVYTSDPSIYGVGFWNYSTCQLYEADVEYNFYITKASSFDENDDTDLSNSVLDTDDYMTFAFAGGNQGGNWYQEPNIYWDDTCTFVGGEPEYTTDVSVSFFDYMVRILPYYDPSDDKTYLINTTDSVIKYRYNFLDDYTIKVYENSSVIFDKDPFTDFDTDDSGILTIPIEIANSESYTLKVEVYDENDALISFLTDEFDVLGVDDYEIPDETETPNYTGIWGDIQNFVSYIFKWLFVPSTSVINQWKTLSTDIKDHFPASLWYDIIELFKFDTYEKKTFGSFKAPAGILGPNEVELISLQPSENMQNSEFWINMKKLMSVAMWFMVIIYIISKFTDKENL